MNTTQFKNYAPRARKETIEAIKARAGKFGIAESYGVKIMVWPNHYYLTTARIDAQSNRFYRQVWCCAWKH